MEATIKLNSRTQDHVSRLMSKGYEVRVEDGVIVIPCNGFHDVEEVVDATSMEKLIGFFRTLIQNKKLVSYSTKFKFEDGKVLSAPFNLSRLGELTAFVAKPVMVKEVKRPSINDLE
jgi:hypothetical protein